MADTVQPMVVPGMDGLFGGSGSGLIGGLILGSLLRNNGNLFGGSNDAAAGAVATQAGVQSVVNQSAIQQELADIKAAIPYNEAQMQLALANAQTALTGQINNAGAVTQAGFSALNQNLNSVQNDLNRQLVNIDDHVQRVEQAVQAQAYAVTTAVRDDGDKTRALITHQYEATLNRQLGDANAEIIALKNKQELASATRGVEVTTTNNINQMQQQQQSQAQFNQLAGLIYALGQSIRSTNEAINVGTGTLTANPVNTNTNIR